MESGLYCITAFDDEQRTILAKPVDENSLERTFVEEETTIDLLGDPKARKSLANGIELYLGEVQVTRSFTGYFTYTLVPRRRCRRCKITYDAATHLCPRCSGQTSKFFDTSEMERHDFPEPHPFGFTILLKTVVCWMTAPSSLEKSFEPASPCKLPGDENRVRGFLSRPSTIHETGRRAQWSEQETSLVERYYETAGKLLRERPRNQKETVLYPGIYGQCLLHALRESLEESRALEIFEATTGYPVTDDLNHVCRKCQTSVLLPALHTLEHTVRMRYPSVALGDPTDLAGMTLLGHPQTGAPVIFWYDNYQGGLGAADKVFDQIERLLQASEATLSGCACTALEGCPHCSQISHCDKHNDSLSKLAARSLIACAKGMTFEIPYEPFTYPAAKKSGFDKETKKNEHRQAPHGIGSELNAGAFGYARANGTANHAASAEAIIDPYQILRVQHKVHDTVLDKAYLVRSEEIARELPPVSAEELNQAYRQISELQRPQDWDIRPTLKPYEILEILPQASLGMVQRIYRVIAREIHPDVFPGDKKKANEMMRLVNETYERIVKEKQKKDQFQNDL